jgi:hypothetical protein
VEVQTPGGIRRFTVVDVIPRVQARLGEVCVMKTSLLRAIAAEERRQRRDDKREVRRQRRQSRREDRQRRTEAAGEAAVALHTSPPAHSPQPPIPRPAANSMAPIVPQPAKPSRRSTRGPATLAGMPTSGGVRAKCPERPVV